MEISVCFATDLDLKIVQNVIFLGIMAEPLDLLLATMVGSREISRYIVPSMILMYLPI